MNVKKILSKASLPSLAAVILIVVIAAPVLASPTTATRTLPTSVASEGIFDVTIEASGCGFAGQVIETLPDGFAYLSCIPDDIGIEQIGHIVKFTFLRDLASFTYTVRAPIIDNTITYTFHGIVKDENKNEYPIEDSDITVTVGAPPPETYTLTMVVDGNGSTSPSAGSCTYDVGDVVNIRAIAEMGWLFDSWSGDLSGSTNPADITMDSHKNVTANFMLSVSEEPASFAVSPLNISPEQVQPNQTVNISTNITNNGEKTGSYQAALYINGQLEDTRIVDISSESPQNVVFSITKATPGTYTVSLGEQQGQFAVVDSQSSSGKLDAGTTIAIVIIVALSAALAFVFRRIKKET